MDSTVEMIEIVERALREDPSLLSDEQFEKLKSCNNMARMFGMCTGAKSFLDNVESYFFPENENE